MDEHAVIDQLTQEGFSNVAAIDLPAGFDLGEHVHPQQSVHVIMKGEVIVKDAEGERSYRPGDRVDIPAGTKHFARAGQEGLRMVNGIKA